uniref:MIF4G domain-containing protein n=1 Tax=Heterorhabditis bacteriophora TaxID=37862 RepID=A0A1I7X171_HETBA
MNEEGGYLGAMTYQCLYSGVMDKLRSSKRDDDRAQAAIHRLRSALKASESASPSFLYDLTKILLAESELNINLQLLEAINAVYQVVPIGAQQGLRNFSLGKSYEQCCMDSVMIRCYFTNFFSSLFKVPFDKTLETLEAIVLDYIKELCERALKVFKLYNESEYCFRSNLITSCIFIILLVLETKF